MNKLRAKSSTLNGKEDLPNRSRWREGWGWGVEEGRPTRNLFATDCRIQEFVCHRLPHPQVCLPQSTASGSFFATDCPTRKFVCHRLPHQESLFATDCRIQKFVCHWLPHPQKGRRIISVKTRSRPATTIHMFSIALFLLGTNIWMFHKDPKSKSQGPERLKW